MGYNPYEVTKSRTGLRTKHSAYSLLKFHSGLRITVLGKGSVLHKITVLPSKPSPQRVYQTLSVNYRRIITARKLDKPLVFAAAKSFQSCPTPSDPMDCSLPGSSVHGIFQARVLEWGAAVGLRNSKTHLRSKIVQT